MPSSRINDFFQDSRGFFWLATEGAGLVRYDGFEFKTIDMGEANLKPIVTALAEDGSGNIWMTNTDALIRYDGLDFKFYYLPGSADRISRIVINPDDEIFVAGRTSAYRLGSRDTLEIIGNPAFSRINDMAWHNRALWYATDSGLFVSQVKKLPGQWFGLSVNGNRLFATGSSGLLELKGDTIDAVSSYGGKWLCTTSDKQVRLQGNDLIISEPENELIIGSLNGLPDDDYSGCFIDRSGVIWLYSNNGLTKLENTAIRLYSEESGISTKVYSVLIDSHTNFYAGAANGLSILQQQAMQNILDKDFPFGVVLSLAEYNGNTWLGTEKGLVKYDGRNFQEMDLPGSVGGYVFALKGTEEALWIGTSTGIYSYSRGKVENITARENLPLANIYAISEGNDGSLWFGTYTEGFIRKVGNHWETVKELGTISFDSLRFNTFTAVGENEIWAGTLSEGIFHITDTGYGNISTALLNFAEIRSMTMDDKNRLWLGSNKGLAVVSRKDKSNRVENVTGVNPFMDEGCSAQSLEIRDGFLLAGTAEGLLTLSLEELEKEKEKPQIAITDIELYFGEVKGLSDYASGKLPFSNVPYNLELPHHLNFLSFTLAGLSGYHAEDLKYRYRIKGHDAWTLAGTRREAVYSNLKPGRYVFEAQVSRDGENWSESTVSFPFYIKSPLWQRWWFITLAALLTAGLVYWYFSERIKRINQRLRLENSLLEMERKALRLQMNPHFIFNALDSISSFIFKNDPKQAVRYLNNFAKLMRLTLESSMEHLHPVETEVSVLKNYLELEKLRFKEKFEYEIEVDEEIDYDVGIPPMLIQPHVENAILHGIKPKEGKGHLSIRFILDDDFLICEIEDDGIGRIRARQLPRRRDHRSMATQINRDRLRLLRLSKSDKIDIQIIDKENPTGTKVIIKLPAESI